MNILFIAYTVIALVLFAFLVGAILERKTEAGRTDMLFAASLVAACWPAMFVIGLAIFIKEKRGVK